jgi:prepilin-type N-terminal cleavage/methylation domain-containing protein
MSYPPQNFFRQHRRNAAFSLIELLAVMAIVVALSAVSVPAIQSVKGGSTVNKAMADLSSTLELARTHAMANRTYVRVLLAEVPASGNRILPQLIALPIYAANGTSAGDMTLVADWPALSKPLVLDDLKVFDTLNGSAPVNTSADVTPMGNNVQGAKMANVLRQVPGRGGVTFSGVIQFAPTGEARVSFEEPARHIKLAIDQPQSGNAVEGRKKNPFILRLSGMNGSIRILRAGELSL